MRKKLIIIGAILMFNIANCDVLRMTNSVNTGTDKHVSVIVRGYDDHSKDGSVVVVEVSNKPDNLFAEYIISDGDNIDSMGMQAREQIKDAMLEINKSIMTEEDADMFVNKLNNKIDKFLDNEKK